MCVCVCKHASKQMCDRITCMKEYNAAALFNLCFSWRQMFEFVRTHGKICNNKTIFSFCFDSVYHRLTALSLSLFRLFPSFYFSLFLSLSPSHPHSLSHHFCFCVSPFRHLVLSHKLRFTFCHFNILLFVVVLPFLSLFLYLALVLSLSL